MGPVCADPIHLTAEITLSLTAGLATQQLTSLRSRTFEYRSIGKQPFFRLLSSIPTNVPTLPRHDSGAGMMPQGFSKPTALYLSSLIRWLAVHNSLMLQRVLAISTLLAVTPYFATLFRAYIRGNIHRRFQDYGYSDIDAQTMNTYSAIEGKVTRYHTGHTIGADDDTLNDRYGWSAVKDS